MNAIALTAVPANSNASIAPFASLRSAQMAFAKAARAWKAVECYGQICWSDEQIAAHLAALAVMRAIFDQAESQGFWMTHDCANQFRHNCTRELISNNCD